MLRSFAQSQNTRASPVGISPDCPAWPGQDVLSTMVGLMAELLQPSMLLVLPEGVEEASLPAALTPFGRPAVAWVVIALAKMLRPVMANEKSSKLARQVSPSRGPAPTQADRGGA